MQCYDQIKVWVLPLSQPFIIVSFSISKYPMYSGFPSVPGNTRTCVCVCVCVCVWEREREERERERERGGGVLEMLHRVFLLTFLALFHWAVAPPYLRASCSLPCSTIPLPLAAVGPALAFAQEWEHVAFAFLYLEVNFLNCLFPDKMSAQIAL
jgi:hypothetical protein